MPKFTVHTHVKNGFESFSFKPGQEVPTWAIGKVGAHAHDGFQAESIASQVNTEVPELTVEPENETEAEELEVTESPVVVTPDFTKPAPAKRGRPRKTEG